MVQDLEARRAEAEAKLAKLRAEFGRRLCTRIDELRAAVAAAADHTEPTRAHAESLAHQLSGTAGSYGFAEVGAVAGELELLLRHPAHDVGRAAELLATLQSQLERVTE